MSYDTRREIEREKSDELIDEFSVSPVWWLQGKTKVHATLSAVTFIFMGGWLWIWVPLLAYHYAHKDRVRYELDGDRLKLIDDGAAMSSSSTEQVPVRDITDIQTSASPLEQFADVGSISFRERDGRGSSKTLSAIPRHEELAMEIGKLQDKTAKETRYR